MRLPAGGPWSGVRPARLGRADSVRGDVSTRLDRGEEAGNHESSISTRWRAGPVEDRFPRLRDVARRSGGSSSHFNGRPRYVGRRWTRCGRKPSTHWWDADLVLHHVPPPGVADGPRDPSGRGRSEFGLWPISPRVEPEGGHIPEGAAGSAHRRESLGRGRPGSRGAGGRRGQEVRPLPGDRPLATRPLPLDPGRTRRSGPG